MVGKLALKKLTASDLTFFWWHYTYHNAGNQKAINLNADIFVERLYPSLAAIAESQGGRIPLNLDIYGPGLAGEYNLQRKIIKGGSYKNWRLDGELVVNPPNEPERFDILSPGDFVVFDFAGDLSPNSAKMVLISAAVDEDRTLHEGFDRLLGNGKMIELTSQNLEQLINETKPIDQHSVYDLILGRSRRCCTERYSRY